MKKKRSVLIVPLAGEGSRMKQIYSEPKPMIQIDEKSIIEHSMDSFHNWDQIIFIVRTEHIQNWHIDSYLKSIFPQDDDIIILPCKGLTSGAVETVMLAGPHLKPDDRVFIWGSDVKLDESIDLTEIDFKDRVGYLACFKSNSKNYSYCRLDKDKNVVEVKEKEVISEWANVGLYGFVSWRLFKRYAERFLRIKDGKEKHIAPLYQLMIDDGLKVKIEEKESVHIFGTLEELQFYKEVVLNKFDIDKSVIGLSSDHSGFELKEECKNILIERNVKFIDFGCYSAKDTDYADWTKRIIKAHDENIITHSFLFCRTGNGQNIFVNKQNNIRNAQVWNHETIHKAIEHNGSNSFSFPTQYVNEELLGEMIWILVDPQISEAQFQGGRHQPRVMKVMGLI